jgi:hypothetical protein
MVPSHEEDELECPVCGLVYCLVCRGWMDDAYTGAGPPEPIDGGA